MRRKKAQVSSESSDDDEPLSKRISELKTRKTKSATNDDSSSESDIENYLQPADKIDLSSSFFNIQKVSNPSTDKNEKTELQKSNDHDYESKTETVQEFLKVQDPSNFHFQQLQEYTKKMDEMKKCAEAYKKKQAENKQENISNLLAKGELKNEKETLIPEIEDDLHSSDFESFSESEKEGWEEVKEQQKEEESVIPEEDLQITVEMPGTIRKKKSKMEVMASIKRRINRIRKEHQVLIHKVHLLCWIAHGNHVSTIITSPSILALALSLVPSEYYRPAKRVDLEYLEKILKWYRSTVSNLEIPVPRDQNLQDMLETQISKNATYDSKEMIVYIFVAMLRSLGIQCRLVLSFQVEPLRPPDSELISLSTKNEKPKAGTSKRKSRSSSGSNAKDNKNDDNESLECKKTTSKQEEEIFQLKAEEFKENRSKSTSESTQIKFDGNKKEKLSSVSDKTKIVKTVNSKVPVSKDTDLVSLSNKNEKCKADSSERKSRSSSRANIIKDNKNEDNESLEAKKTTSKQEEEIYQLKAEEMKEKRSKSTSESSQIKYDGNKKAKLSSVFDKTKRTKNFKLPASKDTELIVSLNNKNEKSKAGPSKRKSRSSSRSSVKDNDNDDKEFQAQNSANKKSRSKSTNETSQLKVEERITRSKSSSQLKVEGRKTRSKKEKEITHLVPEDVKKSRSKSTSESTEIKSKENKKARSSSVSNKTKRAKTVNSKVTASKDVGTFRTLRSRKKLIPQVDGTNDSNSDEDVLLQADNTNDTEASSNQFLKKNGSSFPRRQSKRLSSLKSVKYQDTDSENELSTRTPFSNKNKGSSKITNNLKQSTELPQRAQQTSTELKDTIKSNGKAKTPQKRRSGSKSEEDSDYIPEVSKKKRRESADDFVPTTQVAGRKRQTRKSISGGEERTKKNQGTDVWVEVFVERSKKWISVDVCKGQVNCINELATRATQPIIYIVAWNNNGFLKDVTGRYAQNFNTVTRKLRVKSKWWEETLEPFVGRKTARDKQEDEELERQQLEKPLPKSIAEYKNHPLYVLKRHLLKFEALYPPDAPTLGFVRNEPVYSRQCVYTLHSREIWLKKAKVVKLGEKPYKIVTRPKYDKLSNKIITGVPLEIFGPWQTEDYVPPTAENGVVPRNAFGNVELFQPSMLPKKTVHLKLTGLNKVARRMNIDCAPAITGFDCHGGWCHPIYEGYVVCEEFADVLVAAWELDQDEMEKREQEKIDKRVYGNWKRLIRGLLIRERLKAKYEFGEVTESKGKKKPKGGSKLVLKRKKKVEESDSEFE